MANFAQIDENNIVLRVIVVNNQTIGDLPFPESEPVGVLFCQSLFGADTVWKQTSYNSNFRQMFAVISGGYDPQRDVFTPYEIIDNLTGLLQVTRIERQAE